MYINNNFNDNLKDTLTNSETIKYFTQYKSGDLKARELLIEHNLRLVLDYLHKYIYTSYNSNDMEDLVSVGAIGLIKAVDTFDISKNKQFSSYAYMCIKNEVLMSLRKRKRHLSCLSLDAPVNENDNKILTINDMINSKEISIQEYLERQENIERIIEILNKESERNKAIFKSYFGIPPYVEKSKYELSKIYNIHKYTISKIIKNILLTIKKQLELEEKLGRKLTL